VSSNKSSAIKPNNSQIVTRRFARLNQSPLSGESFPELSSQRKAKATIPKFTEHLAVPSPVERSRRGHY